MIMKTKRLIISTVLFAAATAVFALGGKSGDRSATGRISDLKVSGPMCSVNGRTENGSLWLAYTVHWRDGYERDYTPIEVEGSFSKMN